MKRDYYRGLLPIGGRSRAQILAELKRTEPRGGAGRVFLDWLTADAARLGPVA